MTTATITDQATTEDTPTPMPCPLAGTCTVEKCVNENDPAAQADCKLC